MTRLAGKIAQAVQTRIDYAMRKLVSDKQVKKIDSIITRMVKVRVRRRDLCVDIARLNVNVFSQFLCTRCSVSFRKPACSTFSIRVSENRVSTGVLLHILFV